MQARPGPPALTSTPVAAGPARVPRPSHQVVATFAAVSSSGWRTTSGSNAGCTVRATLSASPNAIAVPYTTTTDASARIAAPQQARVTNEAA